MVRLALVALSAAALCGCEGDLINLGASALLTGGAGGGAGTSSDGGSAGSDAVERWQAPALLLPQLEGVSFSNPTLVEDESLLFYTEQVGSDELPTAIYQRRFIAGAWAERAIVDVGRDELDASSPAISPDGSELWFGQNVPEGMGGNDIWLSTREGDGWSEPELASAPLNTAFDDSPRPLGGAGLFMPLSSRRHGHERWQIYLAKRSSVDEREWQLVDPALLASVNSDTFASSGGFISQDGLSLYFASTRNLEAGSDLFVARRRSVEEAFDEPIPLTGVNTAANEVTPWLSSDGARLYFASDRATVDYPNQYAIYVSERAP